MRRWLSGTLGPSPELPIRTREIMKYYEEQHIPRYPQQLEKPFELLYPDVSSEKLAEIQEAMKASLVAPVVPVPGVVVKREARKVAGGRYTVR